LHETAKPRRFFFDVEDEMTVDPNANSEMSQARRKVYDDAVAELHAINPDIDPVAQFDEAFAAFRVAAQARALKPDRDDLLDNSWR
jgi:hypothetical protein